VNVTKSTKAKKKTKKLLDVENPYR